MAIPPVVTAPPDTYPTQPNVPGIIFSGIGTFIPTVLADNTADVLYRAETDVAIEQLRTSAETAVAGVVAHRRKGVTEEKGSGADY